MCWISSGWGGAGVGQNDSLALCFLELPGSKTEITPELLRQVADSSNLLPNGYKQFTHDEIYEILIRCFP